MNCDKTIIDKAIGEKIGFNQHYPDPIQNFGGLKIGNDCRIPGVQPILQPIFIQESPRIPQLTDLCFDYGNTTFFCGCRRRRDRSRCRECNRECNRCVINF